MPTQTARKFERHVTKPSALHAAVAASNGAKYHSEICVAPSGMYVLASHLFST